MQVKKIVLAALLIVLGTSAAKAAALVIDADGILLGARGVEILGNFYDVEFERGLCSDFYGDCGPGGEFGGQNEPADPDRYRFAEQASWALLDQVLIGAYDLDAGLTNGCQSVVAVTTGRCYILTPFWWSDSLPGAASQLVNMVTVNGSVLPADVSSPVPVFSNNDMVLSSSNMGNRHPNPLTDGGLDPRSAWSVWAVWTPVVHVDEPTTLGLLSVALVGVAMVRRRRNRHLG